MSDEVDVRQRLEVFIRIDGYNSIQKNHLLFPEQPMGMDAGR